MRGPTSRLAWAVFLFCLVLAPDAPAQTDSLTEMRVQFRASVGVTGQLLSRGQALFGIALTRNPKATLSSALLTAPGVEREDANLKESMNNAIKDEIEKGVRQLRAQFAMAALFTGIAERMAVVTEAEAEKIVAGTNKAQKVASIIAGALAAGAGIYVLASDDQGGVDGLTVSALLGTATANLFGSKGDENQASQATAVIGRVLKFAADKSEATAVHSYLFLQVKSVSGSLADIETQLRTLAELGDNNEEQIKILARGWLGVLQAIDVLYGVQLIQMRAGIAEKSGAEFFSEKPEKSSRLWLPG